MLKVYNKKTQNDANEVFFVFLSSTVNIFHTFF